MVGTSLSLTGTVTQSNFAGLVGGAVTVEADTATGGVSHTLTPASGPFAGVTLAFAGTGVVVVNDGAAH